MGPLLHYMVKLPSVVYDGVFQQVVRGFIYAGLQIVVIFFITD
jgi:hypothetical protein